MFDLFKKRVVDDGYVHSPVTGEIFAISEVNDPVFAQRMVGDGVAIHPHEGIAVAPIAGKVTVLFPTHHAVGIQRADGLEVLIHIGLDTVTLEGKGFKALCKQGESVSVGQKLIRFDKEIIEDAGLCSDVMVVMTNYKDYHYTLPEYKYYSKEEPLFYVKSDKD